MLILSDLRWIPWELAHRLTIFRFRDVVCTSLVDVSLFSASRALLIHALYNFAGLVLREHMFEAHVTFERNFQKIIKLRKFLSVTGCRYIHSLGFWLVVPCKHLGFSSEDRTLPKLWIHLEVDVPLHVTATFEMLPFRILSQFYYKT